MQGFWSIARRWVSGAPETHVLQLIWRPCQGGILNFNQLEYFIAIAETGHMSQAAKQLNVSQPALTSNIQKLEREVGVDLFDRVGRRIVLNEFGEAFLPTAKLLMDELEDGLVKVRDLKRSEDNRVVMCTRSFAYHSALEREIYTRFPNISLSNNDCDFADLFDSVMSGDLDFCVVGKTLSTNALSYSVFHGIKMAILVADEGPYASLETARLSDFADAEFAILPADRASGASEFEQSCREAGFVPNIAFTGADYTDILGAVKYNGKVSWVPERILTRLHLDGVHAIQLEEAGSTSHLIMYWNEAVLKHRPVSASVREVMERYYRTVVHH